MNKYQLSKLNDIIQKHEAAFSFDVSTIVSNVKIQKVYYYKPKVVRKSGSLIKLFIMLTLANYVRNESGNWDYLLRIEPTDRVFGAGFLKYLEFPATFTLRNLTQYMIRYSDNIAANKIIDYLSLGRINQVIGDIGAKDTRIFRKMMQSNSFKDNTTTAFDIASFYHIFNPNSNFRITKQIVDDCFSFLFSTGGFGRRQLEYLISPDFWKHFVKARRNGFSNVLPFLRAIITNQKRDRIATHFPLKLLAGICSASDQTIFHDSGYFHTVNGPIIVVVMIESNLANFLRKGSDEYIAAKRLAAAIGKIALRLERNKPL